MTILSLVFQFPQVFFNPIMKALRLNCTVLSTVFRCLKTSGAEGGFATWAIAFVGILIVLIVLDVFFVRPEASDIVVEAHGLLMDVALFGCVIAWLSERRARRERIRRYFEELDDFLSWKEEEGVRRKVGIIRRLNTLKAPLPPLQLIFLSGAELQGFDFRRARLELAHLDRAMLACSDLRGANLAEASLREANLSDVNLREANLYRADLRDAVLWRADFTLADLDHADLRGAVSLTCEQLMAARNWESAYRDASLACGAEIPVHPDAHL